MSDLLQRIMDARVAGHAAVVEQACVLAMSGTMGVIVVADGLSTSAKPSRLVPFGHMATFPSFDAYDRWIENGRPL